MATPVEVKDLETFGYYTAFAKDVKDGEVLVSFENNWKPEAWVPLEYVRRAPPPFNPATFTLHVGDAVEAMAKSTDTEPFSWWKANVKSVKGDFIYISYAEWGNEYDEVLEKEMLRPLNKNPPLTAAELKKSSLAIPADVWNSESRSLVQDFSTYAPAGAFSISIDPEGKQLTVIGTQRAIDRVLMIAKLNFKHLTEIERLRKKTRQHEEKMKKLEERKQKGANESFQVHQDLMGLVIGKGGKNVKDAESIPGVTNIRVDSKTMTVHIFAKTAEAALEARRRLEFVEVEFPVKRGQIARLVGRNFANIREIEQESKVIRIRAPPDERRRRDEETGEEYYDDTIEVDPEEEVPFVITGTVEAVDTAKFAMEYALSNIAKVTVAADLERQTAARRAEMEEELGYLTDEDQPATSGPQGVWRGRGRGFGRGGAARGGRGGGGRYYEDDEEGTDDPNWREGEASGDGKKRRRNRRNRGNRARGDEGYYSNDFGPAETKGQQQGQGGQGGQGGRGGGRGGQGQGAGRGGQGAGRGGQGQPAGRGGGGKSRDGAPTESYKKVQPQQSQQSQQKKPQQQSTPQNPSKQQTSNDSKQAKTQQTAPVTNNTTNNSNNKGGVSAKGNGSDGKVEDKKENKKENKKEDPKDSKKAVPAQNQKEQKKEAPKETTKDKPKEQSKGGQEKEKPTKEKEQEKEEAEEEEENEEQDEEQGGDEEQDEEE